jgi:hypothetical protein
MLINFDKNFPFEQKHGDRIKFRITMKKQKEIMLILGIFINFHSILFQINSICFLMISCEFVIFKLPILGEKFIYMGLSLSEQEILKLD